MAFERSTPLARPSREPVEKPRIVRGHATCRVDDAVVRNGDKFATITGKSGGKFRLTFHRVEVIAETDDGAVLSVWVRPDTVVTWDHLA